MRRRLSQRSPFLRVLQSFEKQSFVQRRNEKNSLDAHRTRSRPHPSGDGVATCGKRGVQATIWPESRTDFIRPMLEDIPLGKAKIACNGHSRCIDMVN